MKLPALLLSDLHLTANPRDEYRWELFKWVAKQVGRYNLQTVAILGDLTDAKDYHSAELTNRVVHNLVILTWLGVNVIVLMGNHDYLRKGHAYFKFINEIPKLRYITEVTDTGDEGAMCCWLPHTKTPAADWGRLDFSHFEHVFMHQTIGGAISSNGQEMRGDEIPNNLFDAHKVWSGDIHVPQVLRGVEYVGSPYHVHFGDSFRPRCVLLDDNGFSDLHFRTISRVALDIKPGDRWEDLAIRQGDQVKVRMHLEREDLPHWQAMRRKLQAALQEMGAEVHGVQLVAPKSLKRVRLAHSPVLDTEDVVLQHCQRQELGPDMYELGLELLS